MLRKVLPVVIVVVLALVPLSTVFSQDTEVAPPPGFSSWDDVLEQARGTTVDWYMWGGQDSINDFVDTFYGTALLDQYDITLNRVGVSDIAEIVQRILDEGQAGTTGEIDALWINGENFFALKQASMLYGPFGQNIPNSVYVNWDNPAVSLDFTVPTDYYESPWSSAQFHFVYDTARMTKDELPRTADELTAWIMANPGKFTYIAPPHYEGTRFLKVILYEISGGYEQWQGEFNQELWDEWSPKLWDYLNAWKPYLWSEGTLYPQDNTELQTLFANGEVDFSTTQATAGASRDIADGRIPSTSQAFMFYNNMIGDYNYIAIPANSDNVAGGLVLANLILEPYLQAAQLIPSNGFGLGFGIDPTRVTDPDDAAALQAALDSLTGAVAAADASAALAPDMAPTYQTLVEEGWRTNVLGE